MKSPIKPQGEGYSKTAAAEPEGLFAKIKKSSKYYGQGLNKKGKACVFPVQIRQPQSRADWPVKGGVGGQYRLTDVMLYWRDNNGHFVKIKG